MSKPNTTGPVGYICKQCDGPAPVGVGYAAYGPGAAEASDGLLHCACGWSLHPDARHLADVLAHYRCMDDTKVVVNVEEAMRIAAKFSPAEVEKIIEIGKH